MIKSIYKKRMLCLLMLTIMLFTGCRVRFKFYPDKEDTSIGFQNLPNGTVVSVTGIGDMTINCKNIIADYEVYDYEGNNYPVFEPLSRWLFNSTDIEEVIFYGVDDVNSLSEVEEIHDRLLPIGSIVEVDASEYDLGVLTLVIIAHNPPVDEVGTRFDYSCTRLNQIEEQIYNENRLESLFIYIDHHKIEKVLYVAPETKFAESVRLKLMEKDEMQGFRGTYLSEEELEECRAIAGY